MKRNLRMVAVSILLAFGSIVVAGAQDDGPTASLRLVVVRDSDGKPLRNAQVILHPVKGKVKQASGEIELKTDVDGKTNVDSVPFGPLRVQVLVPRFQTFGEDYQIDKPEMEITIKLKHPSGQYSIYDNHGDDKKPQ